MNKQRIKTNLAKTAVNVTYYGGTIGAGLAFHHLLNNDGPLAITILVAFVLVVEGLLRTLLDEVLNAVDGQTAETGDAAVIPVKTEEATR